MLKQHPLSAAFPAMQADEYQSLMDSIGEIGVQNPVTLYDGMVIDGWHRYRAATECGMDCPTIELGEVDPKDFVIAQNKARRNLTASQRAAAVTSVYQWAPANIGRRGAAVAPLEKTSDELAVIAGVAKRTIQYAKTAHKAGLGEAVKNGEMTVEKASRIATGKPAKPVPKPVEVPPVVPEDDLDAINILSEENNRLNDRLAIVAMDATAEERNAAAETIADLRHSVKTLTAELDAVRISRDGYMRENAEMKSQLTSQRRQLDKLNKK